jgi:hypothetical protein
MALSLEQLEEALRLRRQIDALKKRLSSILGQPSMPRATRAKLSAAAKARWARLKKTAKKKSADIPTLNPGSKYRIR